MRLGEEEDANTNVEKMTTYFPINRPLSRVPSSRDLEKGKRKWVRSFFLFCLTQLRLCLLLLDVYGLVTFPKLSKIGYHVNMIVI